ncbi:contractile injection system tape measure protein [Pareuzebyella sediminis]|uniref:contractile injection system tape measure protein n=1 Tax=Pareuzebyella sediminis TaxID=2607998 RepID=UPI0011F04300|nr:contractile injection system tape measure protein [Pareuzebyella sediminis]
MNVTHNLNTINNAVLNFELETLESKMGGSSDFVSWAKSNILEAIDHHADNLTEAHTVVEIPDLEIALNLKEGLDFFKDSLAIQASIWDQVYNALKIAIKKKESTAVSAQHYWANVIFDYLKTGQVRESYETEDWNALVSAFFEELLVNDKLKNQWLAAIKTLSVFVRFFGLRSQGLQDELIASLTGEKDAGKLTKDVLKLVSDHPDYFRSPLSIMSFYHTLFGLVSTTEQSVTELLSKVLRKYMIPNKIQGLTIDVPKEIESVVALLVKDGLNLKEIKGAIPEKSATTSQTQEDEAHREWEVLGEGVHISQAGLVLLAPFLTPFLKNIGYVDEKGERVSPLKIPIILHYLATGETRAPEWKLTLPKILAGLRPGQHCDISLRPSQKLDAKIEELLNAVIGHWEALKNTSPDGLRTTFLNREGMLRSKNGFYYLTIKEQTVDILLNYVSWNYSTVRFNWMSQILFVEWIKK